MGGIIKSVGQMVSSLTGGMLGGGFDDAKEYKAPPIPEEHLSEEEKKKLSKEARETADKARAKRRSYSGSKKSFSINSGEKPSLLGGSATKKKKKK